MLCFVQASPSIFAGTIMWHFLKDLSATMKDLLDSQITWLITLGAYIFFFVYSEVYLFDVITMTKTMLFHIVSSSQN